MRVTEHRMLALAADAVSRSTSQVNDAQREVTTGIRVDRPSVDVAGWVRSQRAQARESMSEGRGASIASARDRLEQSAGTFDSIGSILQRARELSIMTANDSFSAGDRNLIATEVRLLVDQGVSVANRRSLDGEYLLAGTTGDRAFDGTGAYLGNGESRTISVGEQLQQALRVSGADLTAARGVDVFSVLSDFATALEGNDTAGINTAIGDLATATDQVADAYARVGFELGALNSADDSRDELEFTLTEIHVNAVEADAFEAASSLARGMTALQSAQLVTQRIISLLSS